MQFKNGTRRPSARSGRHPERSEGSLFDCKRATQRGDTVNSESSVI
jgi:hypothetical protein